MLTSHLDSFEGLSILATSVRESQNSLMTVAGRSAAMQRARDSTHQTETEQTLGRLTGQTTVSSLKLSASPIGRALKLSEVPRVCSMLSSCRGVGVVQSAGLVDCVKGSQIRLARELPRVYAQRVQEISDLESNLCRLESALPTLCLNIGCCHHTVV